MTVRQLGRVALRRLWLVGCLLGGYLIGLQVFPAQFVPAHNPAPAATAVEQLYAAHDCAATPAGRPLLLIDSPSTGPVLIAAATTPDGRAAEQDRLSDLAADLYGWCRR